MGRSGLFALVDEEDYERVRLAGPWSTLKSHRAVYAQSCKLIDGKYASYRMHQVVMGAKGVDHINGDGLDNRKSNLRLASPLQNARNRRPQIGNPTPYKGVQPGKAGNWRARIRINGVRVSLGHFETEETAARAYDAVARAHFGEFAWLNFTDQSVAGDYAALLARVEARLRRVAVGARECRNGHPATPENRVWRAGSSDCLLCRRDNQRRYRNEGRYQVHPRGHERTRESA